MLDKSFYGWCLGYMAAGILIGAIAVTTSCGDAHFGTDNPPDRKNRVPTMSDYAAQAQQAAKDAQAAADRIAQVQKDIDAAVAKLNGVQRDSSGNLKEGRAEVTGPGTIVEFSKPDFLSFLFIEKAGFSKRFYPVCDNQALPANRTVMLNYHWFSYYDQQHPGCYVI